MNLTPDYMLKEIVAGVMGGLVTSLVLLLTGQWWQMVLVPWFENTVQKGARIDGVWRTTMTIGSVEKSEVANLKQKGHRITGTVTYAEDTKGRSHTYEVAGDFYDNVFSALLVEVGKARVDRGALLLTLKTTSQPEMVGLGVWFDAEKPTSSPYRWVRETD